MQLLTDGSFFRLQLFLLSCSLLHFQPFYFLFALLQLTLKGSNVCLMVAMVIYQKINSISNYQ